MPDKVKLNKGLNAEDAKQIAKAFTIEGFDRYYEEHDEKGKLTAVGVYDNMLHKDLRFNIGRKDKVTSIETEYNSPTISVMSELKLKDKPELFNKFSNAVKGTQFDFDKAKNKINELFSEDHKPLTPLEDMNKKIAETYTKEELRKSMKELAMANRQFEFTENGVLINGTEMKNLDPVQGKESNVSIKDLLISEMSKGLTSPGASAEEFKNLAKSAKNMMELIRDYADARNIKGLEKAAKSGSDIELLSAMTEEFAKQNGAHVKVNGKITEKEAVEIGNAVVDMMNRASKKAEETQAQEMLLKKGVMQSM